MAAPVVTEENGTYAVQLSRDLKFVWRWDINVNEIRLVAYLHGPGLSTWTTIDPVTNCIAVVQPKVTH
jgi:hypothetical protein